MRSSLLSLLAAVAAPALAQAAEPSLSEVVVTTTRLPAALAEVSGAKVIDRAEIERRNVVFAADVLATTPGAAVTRNGPFGGVSSVQLRGMPSDKTLVLIDGVPVNDASQPAGSYDFASLDLADVERIEVLSGPQGSLWGSDAIGGVINVLTREVRGVRASGEYGSFDTWRATGAAGASGERGALSLNGAVFRTGGISKADARDGNTERDGFDNLTLGAAGRLTPAAGLTLDARLRYNRARTDYDGFGGPTGVVDGPDTSHVESGSGLVRARFSGPFGFAHSVSVDRAAIERRYGGPFPFEAKGGRTDYRWLAERAADRTTAFALGLERQDAHEDTGSGREAAGNTAAFAIGRWTPEDRLVVSASARYDDPEHYAGRATVRVSGRAALGRGFSLAGSWGQGFKTPSLFQTTYPCGECATPGPNRALRPERAQGLDATLGWEAAGGRASASVTAYRLRLKDRIDYRYPLGYVNVARARSHGVEAQARLRLGAGFAARAAYAWTDAKDSLTGEALRVPRHAGSAGLEWGAGRAQAALLVRAQSAAPDVYGRVRGFAVTELSGAYALTEAMRLTLRVENLFDASYQQAFGYGEPGRSAYLGVAVSY